MSEESAPFVAMEDSPAADALREAWQRFHDDATAAGFEVRAGLSQGSDAPPKWGPSRFWRLEGNLIKEPGPRKVHRS